MKINTLLFRAIPMPIQSLQQCSSFLLFFFFFFGSGEKLCLLVAFIRIKLYELAVPPDSDLKETKEKLVIQV